MKPHKKVTCSWTEPAYYDSALDCERPISPTACGDLYGPELMFAHVFPKKTSPLKKQRIGIIKVAQGSTEIKKNWMKGYDGNKPNWNFWQDMLDAISAAEGSIEAFVWFQGEDDSFDDKNKEEYLENLTTFIADVRSEIYKSSSKFESPSEVPVVIVELGSWIYNDIDRIVINAQRTFVKE